MNKTEAYNSMMKILLDVPEAEREPILGKLSTAMKSNNKVSKLLERCRQGKVTDDIMVCPRCGSVTIVKNGHKDGRQRYLCKDCRKTFGDTYGTLFYHSRLPAVTWEKLISLVLFNRSVRAIARNLNIHRNTALFNIHRVCAMLEQYANSDGDFTSIAEADEWYYPLSFSGMKDKEFFIYGLGRMPRHHRTYSQKLQYLTEAGIDISILDSIDEDEDVLSVSKQARLLNGLLSEEKHKRGISNDLIAVLTCVDRNKSNITLPSCLGRITTKHIKDGLGDSFAADAILVTDSHSAYRGYAKDKGIHLEQIPSGQHSKGPFNLARVNSYHSRLSDLSYHHKVVASKYCTSYFALYQWQDKHRNETTKAQREQIFDMACGGRVRLFQRKHLGRKMLPFDTKGIVTIPV